VIIGAAGFVGRAVVDRLSSQTQVVPLGRQDVDLTGVDADRRLAGMLKPKDCCVFIAARAPCKTPSMLAENVAMADNLCRALAMASIDHLVYVSSDAVYADSPCPLTEASARAPDSLHGVMHLARESMLRETVKDGALAILRPTLIYGAADPHNGYGPNRFRRLAEAGQDIVLFGEGEERRDHVLIDDIAEVVTRVVLRRSIGALNVATGAVHSFRSIAEQIVELNGGKARVVGSPRTGPMPHGGYRAFDVAAIGSAFPDFQMTQLRDGLERVHRKTVAG
jgi:UDP-glucose 4-epimerase